MSDTVMTVRKVAAWLGRAVLFVAITAAGFVAVFVLGAFHPQYELDIYLWGGILAWGLANRVDSAVFDGGTVSVKYVNRMLDERHERFKETIDRIYRGEAEARRLAERLAYLRGVNDAHSHPERIRALIDELKAEETARLADVAD